MASKYTRIVNDDPTGALTLDYGALAYVLSLMTQEKVRGLTLTKGLRWVAHVQRDGVLYQKEFPFGEKAQALAWLLCTRAQLQLEGRDTDQRGRWKRNPEVAK
ncbi:hypothetical protein [Pseudomonas sp. M5]|uniref:hypothetical protein n=1 Tax=Pseudomonas sp. M5 TaxID=1620788 RepID=UPI0019591426|nr:hypothetical protein [Pseudomonas sp. M5]MBM7397252.1 hypothetical protein [Pseudomonas sp. M5]HDS1756979.1 hypothetical protein [Pseudomonas putida]